MMKGLVLGALALVSANAVAGEALWNWEEGEKHRYVIRNEVALSKLFQMNSETNENRRVIGWITQFNLGCEGKGAVSKKAFRVSCTIDDMLLVPEPNKGDVKGMLDIANEWDDLLLGARVDIEMKRTGEILDVELSETKIKLQNVRGRELGWAMRAVIERALAGLDVRLPKKGDTSRGEWVGKPLRLASNPTQLGMVGRLDVVSTVDSESDERLTYGTTFEGTRGPDEAHPSNPDIVANLWKYKGFTQTVFDKKLGVVQSMQGIAEGEVTPSSLLAGAAVPIYSQGVRVDLHPFDAEIENFGPNALLTRVE